MFTKEADVYLIASTGIHHDGMAKWLEDHFGKEALDLFDTRVCEQLDNYNDGAILVEMAARRCYKSFAPELNSNVTKIREDHNEYIRNVINQEHGSTFAHATMTFAIENCSRIFTHELVRNAIGNAFSQESGRYVAIDDLTMYLPDLLIEFKPELEKVMLYLVEVLNGIKEKNGNLENFSDKKQFTSALRRFAPSGLNTGIVVTCNMRSLRWLMFQRTQPGAEEEIIKIVGKMGQLAIEHSPSLFQDFELRSNEIMYKGNSQMFKSFYTEHAKI